VRCPPSMAEPLFFIKVAEAFQVAQRAYPKDKIARKGQAAFCTVLKAKRCL
jgi:hypothetical protein